MIILTIILIFSVAIYCFYVHQRVISNEDLFIVYLARTRHGGNEFLNDLLKDAKDLAKKRGRPKKEE